MVILEKCSMIVPEHSVHPIPGNVRRGHGGGSQRVFEQFACLKLVPSKWRSLVPPTSG